MLFVQLKRLLEVVSVNRPDEGGPRGRRQQGVRLRHRGRRIGGLRARQPPVGGPGEPRAAPRSRGQGQQLDGAHPARLREAARQRALRMVLPHRADREVEARRGLGAGQDARRLQRGQRDGLQPRRPVRLGRPRRRVGQRGVGVGRDPPPLQGNGGQPVRHVTDPRSGRPARPLERDHPQRAHRRHDRRRRRDRTAARRRPQRGRRRTHRVRHGEHQGRPTGQRRRGLPAPRRQAPEPHGRHRLDGDIAGLRGRQGGRRTDRRGRDRRPAPRESRGDPRAREHPDAEAPPTLGHRSVRRAARRRHRRTHRPTQRRCAHAASTTASRCSTDCARTSATTASSAARWRRR